MLSFYRLRAVFTLLAVFSAATLFAQLTQRFDGLARTQVQYLLDKISNLQPGPTDESLSFTPPADQPLEQALAALRQQLMNLPAITQATWRIDSLKGKPVAVSWTVSESRTILPLLNIGGIKGNFFYLLGVNDIHFRGRGQQLTAFYQNIDGEHNYYVGLTNQTYRGSRWGYALESGRYAAIEPLYFPNIAVNYAYANLNFGGGLSYTTLNQHVFRFGISNFYERYRKLSDENTPGPEALNLRKGLLKLSHYIQEVDYFGERHSGSVHQTVLQLVHNFDDIGNARDFLIGWHDFRLYRLVGTHGNLAGRLRAGLSSNENSPFAPFVLDSQVNIRGSGNRIDRGTGQLVLNLEYRHTVWKERNRQRFAVQLVGFSDLGTWRNPGGEISDFWEESNLRHFVGGGVRIISLQAFNALIRVDYGVDVRNTQERGVVVGFGQYF